MEMGTCDSVGFFSIRRCVWTKFYIRGSDSETNIVSNEFAGPGLIFLNPDLLSVYPNQNC
jgi:hypothetical protein